MQERKTGMIDQDGKSAREETSRRRAAIYALLLSILVGLGAVYLYASQTDAHWPIFSVGLMIAAASLFVGGLLGFLFGIPRTLQGDRPAPAPSTKDSNQTAQKVGDGETATSYAVNTNLEQISDWLTKILVGVGLTQLTVLPNNLWNIAEKLATGLASGQGVGTSGNTVLALTIIVFYSICGFMLGYLWTRLYLAGAFRQADFESLQNKIEETQHKLANDEENNLVALTLTADQLNRDTPDVDQDELTKAIKGASQSVRMQIFNQAQTQRSENWKEDKPLMEKTIPIFLALKESDPNAHRYYGQLGYASKDQRNPKLNEAIELLDTAIKKRAQQKGFLLYEFNRALSRIMLDNLGGKTTTDTSKKHIVADLRVAAQRDGLKEIIKNSPDITTWVTSNNEIIDDILKDA